jgi:hypothetical protein
MKWGEALKIYNEGKNWCMYRRGTPEHAEVVKIMNSDKPKKEEKKEEKPDLLGEMRLRRIKSLLPLYNDVATWKKTPTKKKQEFCEDLYILSKSENIPKYSKKVKDELEKIYIEPHLVKYFKTRCFKKKKE